MVIVRMVYSLFVTSLTRLFCCAWAVRSFRICFFCCCVSTNGSPLHVEIVEDLEKFTFYDIPLFCLFY
jgi:hypothetical protein